MPLLKVSFLATKVLSEAVENSLHRMVSHQTLLLLRTLTTEVLSEVVETSLHRIVLHQTLVPLLQPQKLKKLSTQHEAAVLKPMPHVLAQVLVLERSPLN